MTGPWLTRSTAQARQVVRDVFASMPEVPALSTKQNYQTALTKFPDEHDPNPPPFIHPNPPKKDTYNFRYKPQPKPEPPAHTHALRSIRYLKKFVLEEMEEYRGIEKVLVKQKVMKDSSEAPTDVIKRLNYWSSVGGPEFPI